MPPPVIGTCRLCLRNEPLKKSHIIPRWAFLRVGKEYPEHGFLVPVHVTEGVAEQRHEQYTDNLLCEACEQRFSRWEAYTAQHVRHRDNTFPALTQLANIQEAPSTGYRWGDASGLNVAALARFASSVIWRASVSQVFPKVQLGASYDEQFRRFLLDDEGWSFPEDAVLFVEFIEGHPEETRRMDHLVTSPTSKNNEGYDAHWFCVMGMNFRLIVGGAVPKECEALCLVRTRRVFVTRGEQLFEVVAEKVMQAAPKGKLLPGERFALPARQNQPSSK